MTPPKLPKKSALAVLAVALLAVAAPTASASSPRTAADMPHKIVITDQAGPRGGGHRTEDSSWGG
ncbi:hypothetical protein AB0A70_08830 [Streptomyces morookaense]|uniref:hypothetical protein n=1 Tax=Streptomyces morookaense TaxID=1970 RepID=UPI0033DBA68C